MDFNEYVQNYISPLTLNATLLHAIDLMESQNLSHFPIVDNNVYLGSLSVEDIYDLDSNKTIKDVAYLWTPFFVREQPSWFELYEIISKNKANVIPVLNTENKYIGYYILEDINNYFMQMPLFTEQGVILDIEHKLHKYSFSEVAQIIESHNGKLLGAFVSSIANDLIRISIKFTSTNINDTIQSFRRYEYQIITDHTEDFLMEELKDRSNYLDKYLNL